MNKDIYEIDTVCQKSLVHLYNDYTLEFGRDFLDTILAKRKKTKG